MKLEILEMYNLKEMSLSAEIFLSCSILQLTFYAISTSQQKKYNFIVLSHQIYYIGVLILFLSVLLVINENSYFLNFYSSNNSIINDYLSFSSKLFVGIISLIFLIIISTFSEDKAIQNNFEYVMLILISVLGIFLLCSSNDLITAYLSIELQSIAFYIMSAFKKNSTYSIESSLKYFVVGSLSSAFFLMGSAIIYGCLGSLNFSDLKIFVNLLNTPINYLDILQAENNFQSFFSHFETNNFAFLNEIYFHYTHSLNGGKKFYGFSEMDLDFIYLGFSFLCLSLFIKLALSPFHLWSLDVYEGSPSTTTAFFATVPKIGLFVLLSRICYEVFYFSLSYNWQIYFIMVAVTSVFFGSFGGLEQRKLKSLLAYSSITHTGYLLLCFSSKNLGGVSIMLYYIVIFMISSLCFWSVYLFLIPKNSFYLNKKNKELGDLVLLKKSNPVLAFILLLTLFSMAGIPPIVGFLAKILVFLEVIKSSAYFVALLSILLSTISTFYYIRVIKVLYFENVIVGKLYEPITTKKSILISILSCVLIILFLDPSIIYLLFEISTLTNSF